MRSVWLSGRGASDPDDPDVEDVYAQRWDARRPFHPEVRPLLVAVARALGPELSPSDRASTGVVVGVDLSGLEPAHRLGLALTAPEPGPLSPADFLFALPSTAAATIGLAAGLLAYQATLSTFGLAGFDALRHGRELVATGRLDQVLVGVLSVVGPRAAQLLDGPELALAAAWRLSARREDAAVRLTGERADVTLETTSLLGHRHPAHRTLAAPSVEAASRWLEGEGPRAARVTLRHQVPSMDCHAELTLDFPGGPG